MTFALATVQVAVLLNKNGTIRLAVDGTNHPKALRALRRWIRCFPETSLNECDHTPFTCATFSAESRRRHCEACAVRKALGWPPLKEYRPKSSEVPR